MTSGPPPEGWERIEAALDPAALVVYEAERIARGETIKLTSGLFVSPLDDIIAFRERLERGDFDW